VTDLVEVGAWAGPSVPCRLCRLGICGAGRRTTAPRSRRTCAARRRPRSTAHRVHRNWHARGARHGPDRLARCRGSRALPGEGRRTQPGHVCTRPARPRTALSPPLAAGSRPGAGPDTPPGWPFLSIPLVQRRPAPRASRPPRWLVLNAGCGGAPGRSGACAGICGNVRAVGRRRDLSVRGGLVTLLGALSCCSGRS